MAFLDELKKEAEAQKYQEQVQTQSKLAAVSQNFLLVQVKYHEIHHYLLELVNQLNALSLDLVRTYYIEGFGQIDDFRPRDYSLSIDSIRIGQKDYANTLVLRFKCATDKTITVERNVPSQIDNLKDYLWQNNLKYQCTEYKNERGLVSRATFNVTNEIPVTIRFSADFENAKIFLQVSFKQVSRNKIFHCKELLRFKVLYLLKNGKQFPVTDIFFHAFTIRAKHQFINTYFQ